MIVCTTWVSFFEGTPKGITPDGDTKNKKKKQRKKEGKGNPVVQVSVSHPFDQVLIFGWYFSYVCMWLIFL